MMELTITELKPETFDGFVEKSNCIIFFYKKMCPDCEAMKICFGDVQAQLNEVKFGTVDSEEYSELMEKFEISHVPSFLVYTNGQLRARNTGIMNLAQMHTFLASI